jgi:glyoxylase-like metal-dependent hydrolase (beta-lactamase superfamily II)
MPRLELSRVSDAVLCVRRPRYLSASYIVREPDGCYVVDAGMETDASDMLAGLAALGATARDVRAIMLTHWHNDHCAGAEALRQASGATVYFHELESAHFRGTAVGPLRRRISAWLPDHGPLSAAKALVGQSPPASIGKATTFRGGELLEARFRALHTPGHTAGHASYLHEPSGTLFAGDAIAVCFGRLWFMSRFLTEDLVTARASMRAVAAMESTAVCPGHRGPLSTGVAAHRARVLAYLDSGRRWPLLS